MRVALLLALFAGAANALSAPVLQVDLDARTVSVRGATGGGEVLVVGFERLFRGHEPVFRRVERVIHADESGRAEVMVASETVSDAFWVAVDLTTGAFGSAVPPGRSARGGVLPAAALIKGNSGRVQRIGVDGDYTFVVVVRPGGGAWRASAGDGAPSDDDRRANGRIEVAAGSLKSLHNEESAGVDDLRNGDVVLVFPTHRMTFLAAVVAP